MKTTLVLLGVALVAAPFAAQQPAGPAPLGLKLPYSMSSGVISNGADITEQAWGTTVSVPGVSSLQIKFDIAELATSEDAIVITSALDGEQQRLTHSVLKLWRNHSAWFNGDRVDISVELAPGSTGNIVIRHVYGGIQPVLGQSNTICGSVDNRTPTNDQRVCRLVTSATSCTGCTGWLISATNTILGAGHCANPVPDFFVIAEFNTPSSNSSGCAQHPPVADQYPVDQSTIIFSDNGVGDDWAVARLHPNSSGTTAFGNQGAYFQLASSLPFYFPPFIIPTLRVTGHGDDSNNATRAYDQQTHIGPVNGYSGDEVRHRVDTEGGNSGSPIIDEATGEAIAIHTHGGCTSSGGYNKGTSVLKPALQSAISSTQGCSTQYLASSQTGSGDLVTCDFQVFNIIPASNAWVGVGITSTSDWDIIHEQATSAYGGTTCDFIIANGHLGTIAPTSGELNRWSGTASAYADHVFADPVTIGGTESESWGSNDVIRLFEFEVTSPGGFDITLTGSTELGWRLYGPGSSENWRSRNSSTLVTSGTVGNSTSSGVALGTGWHCIVVFKNGGASAVTPSQFGVTVCNATVANTIVNEIPEIITNPCQDIVVSPIANAWNVVGVSSASDWDLMMGTATSYTGGADFALANGHNGTISPTWGHVNRFSGTSDATVEAEAASFLSPSGGNSIDSFASDEILELRSVNLTSTGTYAITVLGDPNIKWRFYAPQSTSDWIPEGASIASGSGDGSTVTVTVSSTGYHALLLYRDYGPTGSTSSVMSNICSTTATAILNNFNVATVSTPCAPFTFTPDSGRWNAVGVASTSDWDIGINPAYARSGGPATDYVVANGRNGAISETNGVASRFSGSTSARLQRSFNVTLNLGSTYSANWPTNYVVRMFEFNITTAGSYDITLSGSSALSWRLHEPGANADWRPDDDHVLSGTADGTAVSHTFTTTGWYAISVVHHTTTPGSTIPFQVLVGVPPNPVPSLSSISPNSGTVGGPSFTLTANGSGYVPASTIRWGGGALPTTYVGSTQLTATVPSSLLTSAGPVPVDVMTPAPGGGVSSSHTFTIVNPVPATASLTPTARIAGSSTFILNVMGSNYVANSVVRWNGSNRSTNFISPTHLQATIPGSLITNAGTATVRVYNPTPGGGLSGPLTFTIENPVPTVSSVSPNMRVVGSGSFTITVNGSNFNTSSSVVFDGNPLATTFMNPNTVSATVPNGLITTAGVVVVGVSNPPPGGGFASTSFTIENPVPVATSASPSFAVAGAAAFSMNVNGSGFVSGDSTVHWNGIAVPTTFVTPTQLQATIAAFRIMTPGTANIEVVTAGPGGGVSAPIVFPILGPTILSIAPTSIPILTASSPPQTITITGSSFHPGTQAYADSSALPTTYVNSSTLTCSVGPVVLGARRRGGLAIAVENTHLVPSNAVTCVVGGLGSNHGTIVRHPLDPLPGESFAARLENGLPGARFLLLADATNPTPIYPGMGPTGDFVLSVRSVQPATPDWFILLDGIGVFRPPSPMAVYDGSGTFTLAGFVQPNPPWGLTTTVQGAYLDPGAPLGFRLHWARYPDHL